MKSVNKGDTALLPVPRMGIIPQLFQETDSSFGKFQRREMKLGFCFIFSAVVNLVSTFKRLDHRVKV